MPGYTFVIRTSFGNQTVISPTVRPTILTILARQGPPGPVWDRILTWPDDVQRRIIPIYDELGNPTIDFEEVP